MIESFYKNSNMAKISEINQIERNLLLGATCPALEMLRIQPEVHVLRAENLRCA